MSTSLVIAVEAGGLVPIGLTTAPEAAVKQGRPHFFLSSVDIVLDKLSSICHLVGEPDVKVPGLAEASHAPAHVAPDALPL